MHYQSAYSIAVLDATIRNGLGWSIESVWLLERQPVFGVETLRVHRDTSVRFREYDGVIEGVIGSAILNKDEWNVSRVHARNTVGTGYVLIIVPSALGRIGFCTSVKLRFTSRICANVPYFCWHIQTSDRCAFVRHVYSDTHTVP